MTIVINPDKTVTIHGIKTFIVSTSGIFTKDIVNGALITITPSAAVIAAVNRHAGIMDMDVAAHYNAPYFKVMQTIEEQAGLGFIAFVHTWGLDPLLKASPEFMGYYQNDEIEDQAVAENYYRTVQANDPINPIYLGHWHNVSIWNQYCDINIFGNWCIISNNEFIRTNSIFNSESYAETAYFRGTSPENLKPIWALIPANSTTFMGGDGTYRNEVPTYAEMKALCYLYITMGCKGVSFMPAFNMADFKGYAENSTMYNQVMAIASELKELNDILVLPILAWRCYQHEDSMIAFSNKINVAGVYSQTDTNFNYMLKQSGDVYYLIIINKAPSIVSTSINIQGVNTGTVTKIGTETQGSGTAGKITQIVAGSFEDTFDPQAVHIYSIDTGTNPPPPPPPAENINWTFWGLIGLGIVGLYKYIQSTKK